MKQINKKQFLKISSFAFLLFSMFFLIVSESRAASLYFEPGLQKFGIDEQFELNLLIDNEDESVNAIEGEILYPEGALKLERIKSGSSIINFWIDEPKDEGGKIKFSGIIPGGFDGVLVPFKKERISGKILSLQFRTLNSSDGAVFLENSRVLLHDGHGTEASLTLVPFSFDILSYKKIEEVKDVVDSIPPEEFDIIITRDSSIFNGKNFLIFKTQDKDSGVHHYEVKEGDGFFKEVTSPYLLKDQDLNKKIVVKAIDNFGNERLAFFSPEKRSYWYESFFISIILIVTVLIFFIFWKKIKKDTR